MTAKRNNRIYIVGAGLAGVRIAEEIRQKGIFGEPAAFLDDDPNKIGSRIDGLPVLGPIADVVALLQKNPTDEALIAIPSAGRPELARLYQLLEDAGFSKIRILPSLAQIVDGDAHLIQTREIDPQDLLGRTPVQINLRESLNYLRGRRVVVTGAGGSIGAELCRQLLSGGAQRLYLFGHGENSIYEIDRELRLLQEEGVGERATIVPVIGDLKDADYARFILSRLKADVVFHTAAYKHVPLTEANPVVAVENNVFGTLNLVNAAEAAGTSRLVLISTDKVVDPVSVYGASKRICEEIVLSRAAADRQFMVVRFGNVLGSRGSILPLFKSQIRKGGPITITDPEMTRYFMTIPEAASLVLQAGGVGSAGSLYTLDMGEPVRITDLAAQLIRFYGYEPEREISIRFIGARPGEKINERLVHEAEDVVETAFPRINEVRHSSPDRAGLENLLSRLAEVCFPDRGAPGAYRNRRKLRAVLQDFVPSIGMPENEPEY
jgi:FlaA1/EpsC-like NDP-sugar epimerase